MSERQLTLPFVKFKIRKSRRKRKSLRDRIVELSQEGKLPYEIARILRISERKVYRTIRPRE